MEWISVRDRLPEEKEPTIILLRDGQVFRGEIRQRILLRSGGTIMTRATRIWTCWGICTM